MMHFEKIIMESRESSSGIVRLCTRSYLSVPAFFWPRNEDLIVKETVTEDFRASELEESERERQIMNTNIVEMVKWLISLQVLCIMHLPLPVTLHRLNDKDNLR